MAPRNKALREMSATSATQLREEVKLGEWARCFETAETTLRVEIDYRENEDLSRCAKSTVQSIIVSWAKQHGRRGDLTLGMLQEHFKWYKGQSGSEPGLVCFRFGKESGFLRMLDRFQAWEPNQESSALDESSAPEWKHELPKREDKRGNLLARRGCRQCEEVPKHERES